MVVIPRPSSGHWFQATTRTAVARFLISVKLGVAARREVQRRRFHVQAVLWAKGRLQRVRFDASTKVSRPQAALRSFGDGDVEKRRALQLALSKAQKQDEKIRLAQVALQDAMEEKEYDMREVPLTEARLEHLQKEIVALGPDGGFAIEFVSSATTKFISGSRHVEGEVPNGVLESRNPSPPTGKTSNDGCQRRRVARCV